MFKRTYGWVQNPSNFNKLKRVVQIFDRDSSHYHSLRDRRVRELIFFPELKNSLQEKLNSGIEVFSYLELVGTSKNKNGERPRKRSEAVADGLIQITIEPQSINTTGKKWTDNWTSDGYLRWALSLNLVKHNRENDICSITQLGLMFSKTKDNSEDEADILRKAMLAYPPATQVLMILDQVKKPVTKYFIGDQLGFKGESGFTSYSDKLMKEWFRDADEKTQKEIRSNIEGTSDKYARMICSWLIDLGLVVKASKKVKTSTGYRVGFQEYSITGKGKHALRQAQGNSSKKKIPKFITWEFLAVSGKNRDYIRTRRANILKILQVTMSKDVLIRELKDLGFNDHLSIIENDLRGLNTTGIKIEFDDTNVRLRDSLVDFTIPELNVTEELIDIHLENIKTEIMSKTNLTPKYYELVEIAYNGRRNRDFEILTIDLFKNVYGFKGKFLGGARKPDGIVFTLNYGIIIDTKAYNQGYTKNISEEDKMVRYIKDNQLRDKERNATEWWRYFDPKIEKNNYYYLWISSKFGGKFELQLESTYKRTGVYGAALNVEQLLIGADKVMNNELELESIKGVFNNAEIRW